VIDILAVNVTTYRKSHLTCEHIWAIKSLTASFWQFSVDYKRSLWNRTGEKDETADFTKTYTFSETADWFKWFKGTSHKQVQ